MLAPIPFAAILYGKGCCAIFPTGCDASFPAASQIILKFPGHVPPARRLTIHSLVSSEGGESGTREAVLRDRVVEGTRTCWSEHLEGATWAENRRVRRWEAILLSQRD